MSWEDYYNRFNNRSSFNVISKALDSFFDPFALKEIYFRILGSIFFFPAKQFIYQKYYFDSLFPAFNLEEDKLLNVENSAMSLHGYFFDFVNRINIGYKEFLLKVIEEEFKQRTLTKEEYHRSIFAINFFSDAISICVNEILNPEFVREVIDTEGKSIVSGISNFFRDLHSGSIELCPKDAFIVGKDFANTKGTIVYCNKIMELIHYSPLAQKNFSRPLLIVPPWINKYYILDLGEDKSFIKWSLEKGHDIFLISWTNPTAGDFSFEDYIIKGGLESINFIKKNYCKEQVNLVGYCIGGTMVAMLISYLKGIGRGNDISSVTFFSASIDFSDAGDIVSLISDGQLENYFAMAKKNGYVSGNDVSMFFNVMRYEDLLWKAMVNKYILGKKTKPLDFLFWHSDPVNLSCPMLAYYLKNMYKRNALIRSNELSINGVSLDICSIDIDAYFVASEKDHIVLWQNVYKGFLIFKGEKKFVLSGSGHIAGIINPPQYSKYGFKTNDCYSKDPNEWINLSKSNYGSWWDDWSYWIGKRSGKIVNSSKVEDFNKKFHINDAPGKYVLKRCY